MTEHAERFTGRVEAYERYRMRYPAAVLEILREHCGLAPADVIADVGAGTGMVAELFLAAGHRVVAVEPNAEMRAACARLQGRFLDLEIVDASAESTGLAERSIDLVSVGRAFHWFDQARAMAEFKRILRPGGWVVLVSNRRDSDASGSAKMAEYEELLRTFGTDYEKLHGNSRSPESLEFYRALDFRVRLPGSQRLTLPELAGQTESYSVAPKPGDAGYAAMQEALGTFFAKWSSDDVVSMEAVCEVAGWRMPF